MAPRTKFLTVPGEGYALESVRLALTDDPVSPPQLPTLLPWITDELYYSRDISGEPHSPPDYPKHLSRRAFMRNGK